MLLSFVRIAKYRLVLDFYFRKMIKSEFAQSAIRKYSSTTLTMDNLQSRFKKQISKDLQKTLSIKNAMAVPTISKIVVNMGVKDAILDKKNLEKASAILSL